MANDRRDAAITVSVRLGARLSPARRTATLRAGATVADLLDDLCERLDLADGALSAAVVAVDGAVAGPERPLRDGESVAVVLPVAGG